jgi:hypothetical protein
LRMVSSGPAEGERNQVRSLSPRRMACPLTSQ